MYHIRNRNWSPLASAWVYLQFVLFLLVFLWGSGSVLCFCFVCFRTLTCTQSCLFIFVVHSWLLLKWIFSWRFINWSIKLTFLDSSALTSAVFQWQFYAIFIRILMFVHRESLKDRDWHMCYLAYIFGLIFFVS